MSHLQVELSAMMERKQHEITKNGREGLVSGGSNSFKLVKAGFLEEVALELTPGKQHTAKLQPEEEHSRQRTQ